MPELADGFHGGPQNLLHRLTVQRGGHDRNRRITAHAARVRAFVAVQRPFMVLHRKHRHNRRAVGEGHQRGFLAFQKLFHHNRIPGVAKHALLHDLGQGRLRVLVGAADKDALARRLAVRLDDQRRVWLGLKVGPNIVRSGLKRCKRGKVCCGNAIAQHQSFGIGFGAFNQGRLPRRAEDTQAALLKQVHYAGNQRDFRPHHRQVNAVLHRELQQTLALGDQPAGRTPQSARCRHCPAHRKCG